jgi:hypothetical protein
MFVKEKIRLKNSKDSSKLNFHLEIYLELKMYVRIKRNSICFNLLNWLSNWSHILKTTWDHWLTPVILATWEA